MDKKEELKDWEEWLHVNKEPIDYDIDGGEDWFHINPEPEPELSEEDELDLEALYEFEREYWKSILDKEG